MITTKAGRVAADEWFDAMYDAGLRREDFAAVTAEIEEKVAAIEKEMTGLFAAAYGMQEDMWRERCINAVAAERARLAEAVRGLPEWNEIDAIEEDQSARLFISRAAVLALFAADDCDAD